MDQFLVEKHDEKRGVNKIFVAALLASAAIIAIVIVILSFRPPFEDRMAAILASAIHEGQPI